MRILYLTQWFEPEPAFKGLEFARALAGQGHEVEVATAFPNYPGGKLYPGYRLRPYRKERMGRLTVHRLFVWPSHGRSAIGRTLNYVSFWLTSLLFGLLRGWRYDVVYVYHPPITPALAAALFCGFWRKPLVVEIQDLWPDSVASSGMAEGKVLRLLDPLCRFTYRHAAAIIVQSDGMKLKLLERGVPAMKLERIYNWSTYAPPSRPDDLAPAELREAFAGRINVVYGGNLGQAQRLEVVIDALADAVRQKPDLHIHIFGGGIERDHLAEHVSARKMDAHVTLHGPVPREAMDRIFDLADILVLHLRSDPLYEVTIPSKTQHYLSCGKPIVAGLSGEAAELLSASGAAIVAPPEDVAGLTAALVLLASLSSTALAEMGEQGRNFYAAHLSFEPGVNRTLEIIKRATHTSAR